jgi:hypothetical protein
MLTLTPRINEARKTKTALSRLIVQCVEDYPEGIKTEKNIEGNKIPIRITVTACEAVGARKVVALILDSNKNSSDILENAWCILEDRIRTKTEKCRGICGEIWLGLLNHYWLADSEIYRQALGLFAVEHPFSKILLVSLDGVVETLYCSAGAIVTRSPKFCGENT